MDMIALIEKELEEKAIINFQPMQPGDVPESFADINYSSIKLGFSPQISIENGIPTFINWFMEYYNVKQ